MLDSLISDRIIVQSKDFKSLNESALREIKRSHVSNGIPPESQVNHLLQEGTLGDHFQTFISNVVVI